MRPIPWIIVACAMPILASNARSATIYSVSDLGAYSFPSAISAQGQVTGDYRYQHAFLNDGTLHDLGTLGGTHSYGYGVNDSGEVTGWSETTGNAAQHAFLYDGTLHDLGTLGGIDSTGRSVNDRGHVTGEATPADNGRYHAFLYDGAMHDIGTLGGISSSGTGINNDDKVTGYSYMPGNAAQHAFLYDGTMHDLGTLGGTNSSAFGISSNGLVTGSAQVAQVVTYHEGTRIEQRIVDGPYHAFLYDGTMHDLGIFGGYDTVGYAVNSSGQVTGRSYRGDQGTVHGFLYDKAHGMVDLNSLISSSSGWKLIEGTAINDLGQVSGWGTLDGTPHAFLLTPVPEPSAIVLAGLGVMGSVVCWRRARKTWDVAECNSESAGR